MNELKYFVFVVCGVFCDRGTACNAAGVSVFEFALSLFSPYDQAHIDTIIHLLKYTNASNDNSSKSNNHDDDDNNNNTNNKDKNINSGWLPVSPNSQIFLDFTQRIFNALPDEYLSKWLPMV